MVNTFVKDATDSSPLIRALAIRTMGCIRVDRITEYLCIPLKKALKDSDPYVRKTAAVCVAKLHDINAGAACCRAAALPQSSPLLPLWLPPCGARRAALRAVLTCLRFVCVCARACAQSLWRSRTSWSFCAA